MQSWPVGFTVFLPGAPLHLASSPGSLRYTRATPPYSETFPLLLYQTRYGVNCFAYLRAGAAGLVPLLETSVSEPGGIGPTRFACRRLQFCYEARLQTGSQAAVYYAHPPPLATENDAVSH